MKRILAFLFVCASFALNAQGGGGVFQYSPIWTYTGSNISYTNGSVICGSLTTSGTMSVGSTATITGQLNTSSVVASSKVTGDYLQSTGSGGFVIGGVSGANRLQYNSGLYQFLNSGDSYTSVACGNFTANGTMSITGNATITGTQRTGSLTVAGTMSVSGQTNCGAIVSSQLESTGTAYLDTKVRIGAITTPTANLDVTGTGSISSTFTVAGQTVLQNTTNILGLSTISTQSTVTLTTPASSGTLANLGDVYYSITLQHGSYSGATSATLYWGNQGMVNPQTNASMGRVYIPANSTLVGYDLNAFVTGSAGSANTNSLYVRVDNTTDITLNTGITYSVASGFNEYHSQALNTDINGGSYLNVKWLTQTAGTMPTSMVQSLVLWFKRKQ